MSTAFWREKVLAGVCCLFGMTGCLLMWHEAGLDQPRRPLEYFGGSNKVPFWDQQHPESKFLFTGVGYGIVILGMIGLINRRDQSPGPLTHARRGAADDPALDRVAPMPSHEGRHCVPARGKINRPDDRSSTAGSRPASESGRC